MTFLEAPCSGEPDFADAVVLALGALPGAASRYGRQLSENSGESRRDRGLAAHRGGVLYVQANDSQQKKEPHATQAVRRGLPR
jgi:hypothetical protein